MPFCHEPPVTDNPLAENGKVDTAVAALKRFKANLKRRTDTRAELTSKRLMDLPEDARAILLSSIAFIFGDEIDERSQIEFGNETHVEMLEASVASNLAKLTNPQGRPVNEALTIDNSITNLRRDLNYYGQSGVQLDLEQIENYKSLSAALASSGTTFTLLAEKHSELVQYFLNKSLQAHFDCLGLEDWITQEYYVSVCQQIDQDPSQQVDTSSEDFRRHWSIKLKYENLEYCNALLNVASALIGNVFHGNQVMNEASNYLQMAQTIMDENHPKWDALLNLVSAFDEAQKNM